MENSPRKTIFWALKDYIFKRIGIIQSGFSYYKRIKSEEIPRIVVN